MSITDAVADMRRPGGATRRERRERSHGHVVAIDRLLGKVERDLLDCRPNARADVWLDLERLPRLDDIPLPREIQPGILPQRLHARLLDYQEKVLDTEYPERRRMSETNTR